VYVLYLVFALTFFMSYGRSLMGINTNLQSSISSNKFDHMQRASSANNFTCYDSFNPSAQPNLATCCWYSDSTCCVNKRGNNTNGLPINYIVSALEKIHKDLGDTESDCFYVVIDILCSLCAPNTSAFWHLNDPMTFVMCNNVCNKMYDACISDIHYLVPNATTVPTNPYDLCDMVFASEENTVVKFAETNCFEGVPIETVKSSGCLIDLPTHENKGLSGGAIAGIIIAVFVVAFLILFCAGLMVYYYKKNQAGPADDPNKWFTLPENLFGKSRGTKPGDVTKDKKLLEGDNIEEMDFRSGEVTNL